MDVFKQVEKEIERYSPSHKEISYDLLKAYKTWYNARRFQVGIRQAYQEVKQRLEESFNVVLL